MEKEISNLQSSEENAVVEFKKPLPPGHKKKKKKVLGEEEYLKVSVYF